MANDDWSSARGGLLPIEYPYGNFRKNYYKLTTSGVAVYIGQPMDLDTNGQVVPAQATTGATAQWVLGPVVGFADKDMNALPSSMLRVDAGPYIPASTDAYVLIADDPDQAFVIQADTSVTLGTDAIGTCSTFAYRATSGNSITGYAYCELSVAQTAVNGSGCLQIMGLVPFKNSDGTTNAVGNYAKLRVRITSHRFGWRGVGSMGAV